MNGFTAIGLKPDEFFNDIFLYFFLPSLFLLRNIFRYIILLRRSVVIASWKIERESGEEGWGQFRAIFGVSI